MTINQAQGRQLLFATAHQETACQATAHQEVEHQETAHQNLPNLAPATPEPTPTEHPHKERLNASQFTILVVDDNPTNLSVLVEYLESAYFTVLVAQDGESGLKRARYARPDLILLDVLMPGTGV